MPEYVPTEYVQYVDNHALFMNKVKQCIEQDQKKFIN